MRYLQITRQLLERIEGLSDLIWPQEDRDWPYEHMHYIQRGEVFMVPQDHPNITFIMLLLQDHHWYDDDKGPYKFMRYV